jgi:hypothetical protein
MIACRRKSAKPDQVDRPIGRHHARSGLAVLMKWQSVAQSRRLRSGAAPSPALPVSGSSGTTIGKCAGETTNRLFGLPTTEPNTAVGHAAAGSITSRSDHLSKMQCFFTAKICPGPFRMLQPLSPPRMSWKCDCRNRKGADARLPQDRESLVELRC